MYKYFSIPEHAVQNLLKASPTAWRKIQNVLNVSPNTRRRIQNVLNVSPNTWRRIQNVLNVSPNTWRRIQNVLKVSPNTWRRIQNVLMFDVAFRYVALKARLCLARIQGKTLFLAGRSETLRPSKIQNLLKASPTAWRSICSQPEVLPRLKHGKYVNFTSHRMYEKLRYCHTYI